MQTREQRFALRTMTRMEKIADQPNIKTQYGALCHKLPILIHTAGLAQALAFVHARAPQGSGKEGGRAASAHHQLLCDLAWVLADDEAPRAPEGLLQQAQTANLTQYMHLTRLSLSALVWFKRYAQSLLQVEASDADDDRSLAPAGGNHE